jgi:hypothetical protein
MGNNFGFEILIVIGFLFALIGLVTVAGGWESMSTNPFGQGYCLASDGAWVDGACFKNGYACEITSNYENNEYSVKKIQCDYQDAGSLDKITNVLNKNG